MDLIGREYVDEISDLAPYLRPLKQWKDSKIALYRRGGAGDQLIASAIPRYLQTLGATVYAACERHSSDLWHGNPGIKGPPVWMSIHLDSIWRSQGTPFFDHAIFLETIYENDQDGEQPNCYDRIYSMLGFDEVPDGFKRPVISLPDECIAHRYKWVQWIKANYGRDLTKGYLWLQPLAADVNRSMPIYLIERVLAAANEFSLRHNYTLLVGHHKSSIHPSRSWSRERRLALLQWTFVPIGG